MTDMEITGEHDVRDLEDTSVEESRTTAVDWVIALTAAAAIVAVFGWTVAYVGLHFLYGGW